MDDLPQPLTATECDLRGMEWMPLFGARLFMSDFEARATDEEFRAALRLWWMSWQQVPAASLPDDNAVLCKLAGFGRDVKSWMKIRVAALHGFLLCSDGRFYHKFLSGQATEAWERRLKERERKAAYRARKDSNEGGTNPSQGQDVPRDKHGTNNGTGQSHLRPPDRDGGGDVRVDKTRQDRTGKEERKESTPKPPNGALGRASDDDPEFSAFWAIYPRKDDKGHARKAWISAIRKAAATAIIAGCRGYQFSESPRFVPLPATWLNGERWLQAADDDGLDPVLRASGVTQAMLDEHFGKQQPSILKPKGLLQ